VYGASPTWFILGAVLTCCLKSGGWLFRPALV
jgi:hypothetical protein